MYAGNPAVITAAAATLTAEAYAGRTVVSRLAATQTFTLPAATGTGHVYDFWVEITKTGDLVIQVANATDVMKGGAILFADAGDTVLAFATASTSDTVTLDGTTKGGIEGARVTLVDLASGKWGLQVVSDASGTEATPFSADVS
jgi:hypothetical protein